VVSVLSGRFGPGRQRLIRRRLTADARVLKAVDGHEAELMRRIINADVALLHEAVFGRRSPFLGDPDESFSDWAKRKPLRAWTLGLAWTVFYCLLAYLSGGWVRIGFSVVTAIGVLNLLTFPFIVRWSKAVDAKHARLAATPEGL